MKRYATLALAAIFALSFTANVAAAPVFTGEISLGAEATVNEGEGVNFEGKPDVTLNLEGAEEGLWELSVELGSIEDLAIGEYHVKVTPGPFSLAVWGKNYETANVADAFEFIKSGKKAADAKFRLTTDVAGVGLTVDYDTAEEDQFYAFAKAGMLGFALRDTDVFDSEAGMGASADVTADLGVATVTGGVAFDFQQPDDKGSLAFGVKAESEVAPGLTINGGYTSDGRGEPKDLPSTEISAGAEYKLDLITVGADVSLKTAAPGATEDPEEGDTINTTTIGGSLAYGEIAEFSVEYMTTNEIADKDPTITFEASAEYPVIADVLTISGDFLMVNDKQPGFASGDDYEWVDADDTPIGDHVSSVLEIGASAEYKVTSAFTVTPGFEYKAYTFATENDKASATIFKVDTAYAVTDDAEINFGISNIATEIEGDAPVEEADRTELSAGVTIKF